MPLSTYPRTRRKDTRTWKIIEIDSLVFTPMGNL